MVLYSFANKYFRLFKDELISVLVTYTLYEVKLTSKWTTSQSLVHKANNGRLSRRYKGPSQSIGMLNSLHVN